MKNAQNIPTIENLFDGAHVLAATSDCSWLVAATLARTSSASARTVKFQHFCVGVEFLDIHLERVDLVAANTAKAIGIFQTVSHLCVPNKVPGIFFMTCIIVGWVHRKMLKMLQIHFQALTWIPSWRRNSSTLGTIHVWFGASPSPNTPLDETLPPRTHGPSIRLWHRSSSCLTWYNISFYFWHNKTMGCPFPNSVFAPVDELFVPWLKLGIRRDPEGVSY